MEIHHASLCRARSAAACDADLLGGGAGTGAGRPARVAERSLFASEQQLRSDYAMPIGVAQTDLFHDNPSFRAESHIYEEVGPPELPPTLPPYYKRDVDMWCPCKMCYVEYAMRADAGFHSPPQTGAGCYCRFGGRDDAYSVVGPRGSCMIANADAVAAAGGDLVRQQIFQQAATLSSAQPYLTSLGFCGQFARHPATIGAIPACRTRCPACDAGYVGSSDSRPPSADCAAAVCQLSVGGGGCCSSLARSDLFGGGTGQPRPRESYSEKRGRGGSGSSGGGGIGAWKSTFRSLSPFPLLKRSGSSCSTPTSSDGKEGPGGGSGSGCCNGASGSDGRRLLCCAAVTVASLLLLALTIGLAVIYAGPRAQQASAVTSTRVLGSFRVTQGPYAQYSADLGVNTSQKFSNWSSFMTAQIDYAFSRSNLSSVYAGATVVRFRPGSVFVDFRLTFDLKDTENNVVDQSALRRALLQEAAPVGGAATAAYLLTNAASIAIDPASISFAFDANPDVLFSGAAAAAANSTTLQSSIPPPSAGLCEPIRVPECQAMFWNSTGATFPNFAGDTSQVGLERRVSIMMLLNQRCYSLWNVFVCAAYVPRCSRLGGKPIPPCRRLCTDALSGCKDWITTLQLQFPFNCSQFPDSQDSDICVSSNILPCPSNTFRCDNTSCQPVRHKCDGVIDCNDGTDEANCKNFNCTSEQFRCANGNCRPFIWVCDGHNDCGDGSDEVRCKLNGNCAANMFECNKGGYSLWNETTNCIPSLYTCDHTRDCSDGSDEDPVYCRGRLG